MFRAHCVLLALAVASASAFNLGDADIVFHLFNRANPTVSQPLLASVNSLVTSSFNIGVPTVITIHNHGESIDTSNFNAFVIPAHLNVEDVNVVAVDWSPGSSMYSEGLAYAPQVGEIIAEFVNILIDNFGYSANNIKIVGVGLGGHIAGIASKHINGVVPHIIALDPSLHGWTHHPDRLSTSAATLVEVLHTTAGLIGYDLPLGHLDFYPNGGIRQNGCFADISCSHIYSYAFYAESLFAEAQGGAKFVGTACDSYESAIAQQCSGSRDVEFGGTASKAGSSGIYHFSTNALQPFAQD